jgi:hypothetical protein
MKKFLYVKADTNDTNDADYVTSLNEIADEDIKLMQPLFEAIKRFELYVGNIRNYSPGNPWTHSNNFPTNECCRKDLGEKYASELYADYKEAFELFDEDYVPSSEYGIHTIEEIKVFEVENVRILV